MLALRGAGVLPFLPLYALAAKQFPDSPKCYRLWRTQWCWKGFLTLSRVQTALESGCLFYVPMTYLYRILFSPFGVSKAKDKYLGCQTNSLGFNFSDIFKCLVVLRIKLDSGNSHWPTWLKQRIRERGMCFCSLVHDYLAVSPIEVENTSSNVLQLLGPAQLQNWCLWM